MDYSLALIVVRWRDFEFTVPAVIKQCFNFGFRNAFLAGVNHKRGPDMPIPKRKPRKFRTELEDARTVCL